MKLFILGAATLFVGLIIGAAVYNDNKVLVLAPELTARAYAPNGFYDYFNGECDESCLSIPIYGTAEYNYKSSSNALILLGQNGYGYEIVSDLLPNPEYVNEFDTLVILHNEYVTQELFDVITNHPNVYYLYPNALYGLVEFEYDSNHNAKLNLISGHAYNGKLNAFDWEYDNSVYDEFDNDCLDYSWGKVSNGYQLNCYPENAIQTDHTILEFIK